MVLKIIKFLLIEVKLTKIHSYPSWCKGSDKTILNNNITDTLTILQVRKNCEHEHRFVA